MTLPSRRVPTRRAFATAAMGSLLAGCAGTARSGDPQASRPSSRSASRQTAKASPKAATATSPHALARSVPVRLRIPAIGVNTPVMRLGLAADGTVEVPPIEAHSPAGWYRYSPTPGQVGPSVILAHVTVGAYGDGVFRHLAQLRRGDRIVAGLENGTSAVFAVNTVRTVSKTHFPAKEVYGDVDRPELRLITCGGARTAGGYTDNVIVFAALT